MIITSLLDLDIYKIFMLQPVLHKFPSAIVEYEFKCRTEGIDLVQHIDEIKKEVNNLGTLRFKEDELCYLENLGYFKSDVIEFLRIFKLNPKFVDISVVTSYKVNDTANIETGIIGGRINENLSIKIKGPFPHTILFETFILSIVNEIYFKKYYTKEVADEGKRRLMDKIELVKDCLSTSAYNGFKFADFGTRRRFSKKCQEAVVKKLSKELPGVFIGTSNVFLAKKYGLKPIGTQAHEYFMACQALGPKLANFQKFALQTWCDEYRGDLGIALSDTVGMDAFLRDFDLYFCKLFDGARHDSGDPHTWCDKLIDHYNKMGIDPKTKTAVFSDGLTVHQSLLLYISFKDRINTSFGIGTSLTNDLGIDPIQIVIKMTYCNGDPVSKVSDSPGKGMCKDESYNTYLKKVFKI